jgi:hypothetical protein
MSVVRPDEIWDQHSLIDTLPDAFQKEAWDLASYMRASEGWCISCVAMLTQMGVSV